MKKLAIFGFLALLATLLTAAPAAANGGHFTVRVLGNGTLLVTGDNGPNSVAACQIGDEAWLVGTFVHGTDMFADAQTVDPIEDHVHDVEEYHGVTTDVKFNMRGGDDTVVVNCDPFFTDPFAEAAGINGAPIAPRDVIVLAGSGSDYVNIEYVNVADDVNVQLGSGDYDSLYVDDVGVGDDFLIRGQGGKDKVAVYYTHVNDRADINTGSGDSWVNLYNVDFGRTSMRGGSSHDHITATAGNGDSTDLGFKPRITTANGDDIVELGGNALAIGGGGTVFVSDRLFINTGSGNDDAEVHVHSGDEGGHSYNINMVAGDDTLEIVHDVLESGDLINCGAGDDDLFFDFDDGATIRNCEELPEDED